MFHISLEGFDELERDFRAAEGKLAFELRGAVDQACKSGAEEARRTHRYKDQTGALTRSIRGGATQFVGNEADGEIVALQKYASFVEGGTAPHIIRPKNPGGMLRWQGPGGEWNAAREVHHPGTQPHPFMAQAYVKAERVLERAVEEAVPAAQAILDR